MPTQIFEKGRAFHSLSTRLIDKEFIVSFENLCKSGQPDRAAEALVFAENNFTDTGFYRLFLNEARWAYWNYPTQWQEWNNLCIKLRQKCQDRAPRVPHKVGTKTILNPLPTRRAASFYETFFGTAPHADPTVDKTTALQWAQAKAAELFEGADKVLPAAFALSLAMEKLYFTKNEQQFPILPEEEYELRNIGGFKRPVPYENYKGIHTQNTLQEVILEKFRLYDLGDDLVHRWIGMVDPAAAQESIRQTKYPREGKIGFSNASHGVDIHAIQLYFLIWLIEQGIIPTTYREKGEEKHLTVKEFIQALIGKEANKGVLWDRILDQILVDRSSFSSPQQLSSLLYQLRNATFVDDAGSVLTLRALVDSLTNTYIKANNAWLDLHNQTFPDRQLTMAQFAVDLNDFSNFYVPQIIVAHTVAREQEKGRLPTDGGVGVNYAVVPKDYATPSKNLADPAPVLFTRAYSRTNRKMISDLFNTMPKIGEAKPVLSTAMKNITLLDQAEKTSLENAEKCGFTRLDLIKFTSTDTLQAVLKNGGLLESLLDRLAPTESKRICHKIVNMHPDDFAVILETITRDREKADQELKKRASGAKP